MINFKSAAVALAVCFLLQTAFMSHATPLKRPLSPTCPMLLWQVFEPGSEDPQADINAVPADVRPYTVMMYALASANGNGFNKADYFCNVCSQNGMWCMIQPSSGINNAMNNTNTADYEALLQKYPNLLGFCFCEQTWGFLGDWPISFTNRCELYVKLLRMANQYGGYLYVNEMECYGGNQAENCVGKMKLSPNFRNATVTYMTNYIIGDKYTMGFGYYDNESCCLGEYLSGHAGNYAIRFDEYAWPWSGKSQLYGLKNPGLVATNLGVLPLFTCPEPAQGIPIVEHMMLQGATVIDGPEVPNYSTVYQGQMMPCYKNMICDIFRKVVDSTIKIPSLTNVLAHTPIAYVSDVDNQVTGDTYDGLYMMDGDGAANLTWLKSSGRYPSIPEIYTNAAYEMSFFKTNVLESQQSTRWPTMTAKTNEFNTFFPAEYSTTNPPFFAARRDNRWLTYNPWVNSNITVSASIPLQYNTCTNLYLQYPPQSFGVIVESNQSLQIYFNNYFTDKDSLYATTNLNIDGYIQTSFLSHPQDNTTNTMRTTVFRISGCTNAPTYTLTDRGSHPATTNSSTYASGVFTLTLTGNGPCDITINCAGGATRTNSVPAPNVISAPTNFVPDRPAPPNGVVASPGAAQATLAWKATNCLYYNVKRGTSVNGPFTNVATGISNSVNLISSFKSGVTVYNGNFSCVDTGLKVSNTYYYVVSGVNVSGEGSNSAPAVVTIIPLSGYTNSPVADSYVESSNPGVNYGTSTNLLVKNNISVATRNAYLLFDVHALSNPRSATLTLMPNRVDDTTVPMYYEVAATNWTENGITWNNQPGGTGVFLATNTARAGLAVVLDVTSAVASQATNGGLFSIRITQPTNTLNGLVQFCSREHPTNSWRPTLQATASPSFGSAPVGLTANAVSGRQINVSWAATIGANYYNLRRSASSSGRYTTVAQGIMTTNYSDSGLDSQTTYYYAVSAIYSGGESANSTQAYATTPPLPGSSTLSASLNGNQVGLNWQAVGGADSYKVKRAFSSGGPYTMIASGVTDTNFYDAVYYTGASYYYVVAGVDAGGEGTNSPEAGVTTSTNLTMEPTDDAYVEDGTSTNSNFGTSPYLKVKNQGPNTSFTRISYLRFDVHVLTNALSVKLKLTPYQVDGSGLTNAFEWVTNDNWSEETVYWTNRPAGSGVIITNMRGSSYTVGAQVVVDVTSNAVMQATNDGYLSLRISDPNTNATLIGFSSKEYPTASYHPVLQFVQPAPNTPPTLAAISNRAIGVGMTLLITNSATDSDVPAQTLTFSLPTAPTNAAINASSGVVTWRPLVAQANTTNPFTVMVADNGTPSMGAAQSFVVTVSPLARPMISTISGPAGQLVLRVNGDSGPDYQIQASTNLVDWAAVFTSNSAPVPFTWTNDNTGLPMNFFRILVGPPL
jgi:fibronectin type 3 domain-containing protein